MTRPIDEDARGGLADRITQFVTDHDSQISAAVQLVCESVLLDKIGRYVDADGWIEWDRLAADLLAGLPWSSGELRTARLACSISGQMSYLEDEQQVTNVLPWTLAELLYGLDDRNRAAALDAIRYVATGRLASNPAPDPGPDLRSDPGRDRGGHS
jgi:hypothetical protein